MNQGTPKKPIITAPIVAAVLAAGALGMAGSNYLSNQSIAREIDDLRAALAQEDTSYRFDSQQQFDRAVIANIDNYVLSKQRQEVDAKYAQFQAALESTLDDKHIYGDLGARFTLVEFSDLECPYCKRFHDIPKSIVDASNGNVNWQWKHLPLSFHNPAAEKEAQAAECIAEQKGNRGFWVFVNEVFQHSNGNGSGVPNLANLVTGVGAALDMFRECMVSGRHREKVIADAQQASEHGITGTPATLIVDNQTGKRQLLGGAQPPQAFMAVIRKMLAETKDG